MNFDSLGNGANPYGGVIKGSDDNLYGTATYGGTSNRGTVYKMSTTGVIAKLLKLTSTQGTNPFYTLLQGSDGNFYGPTNAGGTTSNLGTLLKLSPAGTLTKLFTFTNGTNQGYIPTGALIQASDTNFYGTAYYGGVSVCGTVFKVAPTGAFTRLLSFDCSNGAYPNAGVIQGSDGNFYGTTRNGGTNGYGTIFRVTSAGVLTTLFNFSNTNGARPYGGLVQGSDGNFYGTTSQGGTILNAGTIFRITPTGTFTSLIKFNNTNGREPNGTLLQMSDGSFYGTTTSGGLSDWGTVFKYIPGAVPPLTTILNFGNTRAVNPYAGLTLTSDGKLYGTTVNGGVNGYGTVYQLLLP